ncbi:MAG: NADH-quinone oxidoreductase subunit H, partial [Gemmataceae bacterium]
FFITKSSTLVLVMMWLRWSLPRLRIDQVMAVCLKYFVPMSCALLVGAAIWQLYAPGSLRTITPIILVNASALFVIGTCIALVLVPDTPSRHDLPGVWNPALADGGPPRG